MTKLDFTTWLSKNGFKECSNNIFSKFPKSYFKDIPAVRVDVFEEGNFLTSIYNADENEILSNFVTLKKLKKETTIEDLYSLCLAKRAIQNKE